jgi:acetyl esterase/lipase
MLMLAPVVVMIAACGGSPTSPIPPPVAATVAPRPVSTDGGLEYAYGPDRAQRLDLYLPAGSARGLVILIHGGGWVAGDKRADTTIIASKDALLGAGYVVANVNYRLTHYPEPLDDIRAAVEWLASHAQAFGLRSASHVAIGGSAGGHLAALHCARESTCEGYVGLCGIYDLTLPDTWLGDFGVTVYGMLTSWIGCSVEACPGTWVEASPVSAPAQKPGLLIVGDSDRLVSPAQSYRAAERTGARLMVIPQCGHGCAEMNSPRVAAEIAAFVSAR